MLDSDPRELCLDHLLHGRLAEACSLVQMVRDSDNATPLEDLVRIFDASPTLLRNVATADIRVLRVGAAMMELWGTNRCKQWVPSKTANTLAARLPMSLDSAALMILFSAKFHPAEPLYPPDIVKTGRVAGRARLL